MKYEEVFKEFANELFGDDRDYQYIISSDDLLKREVVEREALRRLWFIDFYPEFIELKDLPSKIDVPIRIQFFKTIVKLDKNFLMKRRIHFGPRKEIFNFEVNLRFEKNPKPEGVYYLTGFINFTVRQVYEATVRDIYGEHYTYYYHADRKGRPPKIPTSSTKTINLTKTDKHGVFPIIYFTLSETKRDPRFILHYETGEYKIGCYHKGCDPEKGEFEIMLVYQKASRKRNKGVFHQLWLEKIQK